MENSNSFVEVKQVLLSSVDRKVKIPIQELVTGFAYFEDINKPFVTGVLSVSDSGQNIIGALPIQGGERVDITVLDVLQNEYTYELYVHKISARQFTDKVQTYLLSLISKEAIVNESIRVTEPLKGKPNEIVGKILYDYLGTEKFFFTEDCRFKVKMFPDGKKAHTIISQLAPKSVSTTVIKPGLDELPENKEGSDDEVKVFTVGTTSLPSDTNESTGSSGYLFFENKNGFNFRSIDFYFSDGTDDFGGEAPVAETYEVRPNFDNSIDISERYIIETYKFTKEVDLFEQMRNGVFSTYMVYYNFSTGSYEEYTYSLDDSYSTMSHLGSQTQLGKVQKELSERPSRIISTVVDHETWFDGFGPASPEPKDGGTSTAEFPDFQKHYLGQTFSRHYIMDNQKLEIVIPGNLNLVVGDKLKILLPNMSSQAGREVEQYDTENSGVYLISKIGHNIDKLNSKVKSRIELIRDSSGMKEVDSKVRS